ncbi:MAG: outer membrane protein assembly factor BamB [Acidiferrobacterales bacterium]|nr:outer membrane protein assembly factor BamB [Acidiferrobacterales bacterium]
MKLRLIIVITLCLTLVACGSARKRGPDPTPLSKITASAQLASLWRSNFASGGTGAGSQFINLLPIIVDDQIFGASAQGRVAAIGKSDGKLRWSTDLENQITAGVGVGDGVVAVVSAARELVTLRSDSGELRWKESIDQTSFTPPLVYRGIVVMQTIDGDLLAIDASSGELMWDAFYDQPEFVVFGSPRPLAIGNLVLVGNATGRVFATDLATGLEFWQIYLGGTSSETALNDAETIPVIFGDHLFVSDYTNAVVAYDLTDGSLFWQRLRKSQRRLAVDSDQVYGTDLDDTVFALSRSDGSVRWEQKSLLYRKLSNIALVGDHLVVGDNQGYLHILDTDSGEIIGRAKLRSDVLFGGFLTDGNRLFVSYRQGSMEAFRLTAVQ